MPRDDPNQPSPRAGTLRGFQGGRPVSDDVARLVESYGALSGPALLRAMIRDEFAGRIAVVASFGTESAALLALVAEIEPAVPVLFLDTGKHFPETLAYRDRVVARLGLRDVRTLAPGDADLRAADPDGSLWSTSPDACCFLRKVVPLRQALSPFSAWVTGRKRYQGGPRAALPGIEAIDGRIKINPFATWTRAEIMAEFIRRDLPRHPLEAEGYLSVGCQPCTRRVEAGSRRSGRWAGTGKTECGIHLPHAGTPPSLGQGEIG